MSGGKGNSRANTASSSTTTNTTTTNIDNSVHTSDFGAIQAALDIGIEALRMGESNFDSAANLAGRGLDTVLDVTSRALDTTDSAVRSNEAIASESMQRIAEFGGVALGESFDFARDVVSGAGSAVADAVRTNIEGLQSLAHQTSESSDDRVTRVAMYAFAAIAAVFILPKLFGSNA